MSATPPFPTPRPGQTFRLALVAWCAATAVAAGAALFLGIPPVSVAAAAAACLTPAVLALALAPMLRREWAQVTVICAWTALALGAAFVLGATSAAASWFLIPPAIALMLGRRSLILETGVSSVLAFGLAVALEAGHLAPPVYPAAENPLLAALAVGMALTLLTGIAAASRRQALIERAASRRRSDVVSPFSGRIPAAVLRLDSQGVILAAAGAAEETLRTPRATLPGTKLSALAVEAERAAVQAALEEAMASGAEKALDVALSDDAVVELRLIGAEGGALAVAFDVTERIGRERTHLAQRDQAMAASEAKTRFLAAMSHEIRTPLNAIIGFSDVMKQRLFGPLPARYAEYADLIHESGRHLLDLVGDVLDMSKIEADRYELKLDQMDVRDVAAAATKLVRLRAEEVGVQLELDPGLGPLPARADRRALRQILLNLLSNALKFTPRGGEVRLSLRSEGGDLVMEIADTGAGMSAEEVERIGQPYQQAGSADSTAERGTGLGLSLVAALAQLHGGALEIESEPGKGTTARVRMPVLEAPAAPVRLDARARLQRAAQAGEEIRKAQAEAQG